MRIRSRALLILFLLGGLLTTLACNLTTIKPTPIPTSTQPGQIVTSVPPTLFASITPLGFGGFGNSPTQPSAYTTPCAPPSGWVQYTVQDGDALANLASATGASVQDIVNANCLPDANTLYTGQVIYLPRSPVSG